MTIPDPIKILLIEDHWRMRESLKSGLSAYKHLQIDAEAENSRQSLEILNNKHIDLIIMDYQLTDDSLWGVELTKIILKSYPEIKIIFWSIHLREIDLISAKNVGAHAYLSKKQTNAEMKNVIDKVMHGESTWPLGIEKNASKKRLSPIKMKVIEILLQDKGYKQVAYDLLREDYQKKIQKVGMNSILRDTDTFENFILQTKINRKKNTKKSRQANEKTTRWSSRKRTVEGYAISIKKWFGVKTLHMLGKKIFDEGKLEYRRKYEVEI